MGQKTTLIILGLVLYLLSAGVSYAAFNFIRPGSQTEELNNPTGQNGTTTTGGKFTVPKNPYAKLPKTEECPLNGGLYSEPERQIWEKRRPLGVMIENTTAVRPQSGLSMADVVYEAVAEGGITRFLGIFYCQTPITLGPIRSSRTYYLDWLSEYGSHPLYAHAGGANTPGPADALGQIEKYGWRLYNDIDYVSGSYDFPPLLFYRDIELLGNIATEHTLYAKSQKLWDFAANKRKLSNVEINDVTGKQTAWDEDFVKWTFKDDAALANRPKTQTAEFNFSNTSSSYLSDYGVKWQYDHDSNSYLRFNGGKTHRDMGTNRQILAKNIVILFMTMSIAQDGYDEDGHGSHTLYGTKGTGKAQFIMDGKVIQGTWSKKTRTDRTLLFDSTGAEVKLNRGLTWVEILPIGQQVNIQ